MKPYPGSPAWAVPLVFVFSAMTAIEAVVGR
jgi:hypothetical protein